MTSDRETLFELWSRHGSTYESDSSEGYELADAILAAGFFRASGWEYSGGIEEGDGSITPWKPLRSPAELDEGYLLLRRPVGAWLEGV